MTSSSDRLANFSAIRRLARKARDAGASILFLPECCCFLGETAEESVAAASSLDEEEEQNNVIDYYRSLAREFGLWLSLGGFQEKCEGEKEGKKMYNTHVVLRDDGSTAARYRKIHLFELASEGLHESRSTEPGDSVVVVPDAPCGSLGLSICYDLRFPELYQKLRFESSARVLAVPAAFTRATGRAHWEVLLRARAIETQCAVVAAAQVGKHNQAGKRCSWGQAMIVDAWGNVLAKTKSAEEGEEGKREGDNSDDDDEGLFGIVVADLDETAVESARERMPVAEHREAGRRALGLSS